MSNVNVGFATPAAIRGQSGDDLLGQTLDRIPFSVYHLLLVVILGLVGFIEGYDTAITGALLVLARGPLHLTAADTPWLVVVPTAAVVASVFLGSLLNDRFSRKNLMQFGIIVTTLFTLLIPLAQTANQLIALRIIGSVGVGFAILRRIRSAPSCCRRSTGVPSPPSTNWCLPPPSCCCHSSASCWRIIPTASG